MFFLFILFILKSVIMNWLKKITITADLSPKQSNAANFKKTNKTTTTLFWNVCHGIHRQDAIFPHCKGVNGEFEPLPQQSSMETDCSDDVIHRLMLERLHAGWKLQTVPALYDSRLFESPVMMEDSPAQEPAIKRPSRRRSCTLVYPAMSFVKANECLCATPWCLRDYLAQVVWREDEYITARTAIKTAPNLKQSAKNIYIKKSSLWNMWSLRVIPSFQRRRRFSLANKLSPMITFSLGLIPFCQKNKKMA